MKEEIKIPTLGESITEASIAKLIRETGASVTSNEEIIELETEKVNQVLYAPTNGVIHWSVHVGDVVKIGDVIGYVDTEQVSSQPQKVPTPATKSQAPSQPEKIPPPPRGEGMRKMQQEFVSELQPTPTTAQEKKEEVSTGERESKRPMTKIRQTIANRLVSSLHQAAMLTTFNEVDMSEIVALRSRYKESFLEKHGVKLGLMSFFVMAVVEGLKTYPDFNSYIAGSDVVTRHYFDIGIAVGTERGLVVPVIRNCNEMSFADVERQITLFAGKAKQNRLAIEDLQGGGFTITNGGTYGSLLSTPILNPPQVGILGMHKIMKRAVVVADQIVIRPMMYLALSYDHRLVDGKEAVSFLVHLKEVLEDPSRLLFLDTEKRLQ